MKIFKVCLACINDLQKMQFISDRYKNGLIESETYETKCNNKPKCYDQPERLSEKTPKGEAIVRTLEET